MAASALALPLLGLAGLVVLVGGKKKPAARPGAAPEIPGVPGAPPAGDLTAYIEVRQMPEGPIQYFRQDMVPRILAMLGQSTVRQATPPGGMPTGGQVSFYEVLPWTPGTPRASDAVNLAQKSGFIVLGSLSLPLPVQSGRLLAVMKPELRRAASAGAPWAVLLDTIGSKPGPVIPTAPGVPGAPGAPGVPPMPGMPGAPPAGPSLPGAPPAAGPVPGFPGMPPGFPAIPGFPGVPGAPGVPGVPGVPGMPPGGVEPSYGEPWATGMPPELAAQVRQALADPNMEPEALDQMANTLDEKYPAAAAALRARALELRTQRQLQDSARGGSDFTIRAGDTGSYIAKYYTGNANRWRELPAVNPGMRVVKGPKFEYLVPWKVGETILLPTDWKAWTKPLPPTQSGGDSKEEAPWWSFVSGDEGDEVSGIDPLDPYVKKKNPDPLAEDIEDAEE